METPCGTGYELCTGCNLYQHKDSGTHATNDTLLRWNDVSRSDNSLEPRDALRKKIRDMRRARLGKKLK